MLKKTMTAIFFVMLLALFGASASADGDDLCDDLVFSSEYLEGLCEEICDAVECEIDDETSDDDSSDDSSDDGCQPPSPALIDQYNGLKGPNDPDLPCIEAECPCFTQQQVDDIPPQGLCYQDCRTDEDLGDGRIQNQIVGFEFATTYVLEDASINYCQLAGNLLQQITSEQATACRAIIQNTQFQSGLCPTDTGSGFCDNNPAL